ncbi:hypothetical protein BP00DRAFT_112687 [Aspergillus indologenus CBS 114.80]|uniref:Uncharacterized protein n=1 Tax=Aspergillus indologenus CBS 114.80 TaxID=1450541 RepID=A0A2V5IAJ5_9EURO|nr:hypothetical protein BP00DRAFT_112687 [Aspergillus indologenus CBS 114.80]
MVEEDEELETKTAKERQSVEQWKAKCTHCIYQTDSKRSTLALSARDGTAWFGVLGPEVEFLRLLWSTFLGSIELA